MSDRRKIHAATDLNLKMYALEPTMRWLIAAALDGTVLTYGQIKRRLESEASFSTIFATRIGLVAGMLMEAIQKVEPAAPLINVLVVNQQDRQPSEGAGPYMAAKFGNSRLKSPAYKKNHPDKWSEYFDKAAGEVYAYSREEWASLYERVFGGGLSGEQIELERQKLHEGKEDDFGAGNGKYGPGGESNYHRELRLWVLNNPGLINRSFGSARSETEYNLESGDRIDVVYHLKNEAIVLEVKSRISNTVDFRRGVFQCIKYRAVKIAMDVRSDVPVRAVLVTETEVPGEISSLLKIHNIEHRQVPKDRC